MTHWRFRSSLVVLALMVATISARAEVFEKQVVVSQEGHASDIGHEILRQGGNAVDAAIATAFALAVTHPAAGNLGGGGFLVAFLADEKKVVTFNFREKAPAGADERMYLDADGKIFPRYRAGPRAAGVPGTVRGLGLAHEKLGKLSWAELVRPAAKLAREGFVISETLARSLNAQLLRGSRDSGVAEDLSSAPERLGDFPSSVAAYGKPDGQPWKGGDRLILPDLADTLDRIAEGGPDEFYLGRTADLIAEYMAREGGLINRTDLANYQAKEQPPVQGSYRGFDIFGMGPPSSGGIVTITMLNILEPMNLREDGPSSPLTLHRITEAMRRAFFIRATEVADPDFVEIPVEKLISKSFAQELASTIGEQATPSAELADFPILPPEGSDTTHLSTLDADGNAVALTYTLQEGYGCKAVVSGAGFLLNNEMSDFNVTPGRTDTSGRIGTEANRIVPGKRMLSSMSPTIVLKDGKPRLITGSPGGRTIPNTVLWVVLNTLEFDREPTEAVQSPRTHHAWFPDRIQLEGDDWDEATLADLKARGHQLRTGGVQGDAHTIAIEPETGRIHGAADPRRHTSRASGD